MTRNRKNSRILDLSKQAEVVFDVNEVEPPNTQSPMTAAQWCQYYGLSATSEEDFLKRLLAGLDLPNPPRLTLEQIQSALERAGIPEKRTLGY